jgi:glycosyltransferase involved in cell wall biosynthesis
VKTTRSFDVQRPAPRTPTLVSVVIPLRNGARWLGDQLEALLAQTYPGAWEVVIADNGSTDAGVRVARGYAAKLPALAIADASRRRGINTARNAGALAARGDLLLFCDADDVVGPGWIDAMVEAARGADIVGGRLCLELLNDPLNRAWRPAPPAPGPVTTHDFLPYPPGGNLAVWAAVARELRWDERFRYASSDQEFGWRAQLAGYTLVFAPQAVVHQRLRAGLAAMAWQQCVHGMSAPKLLRAFRGHGIPAPDNRAALARWRWLAANAPDLWRSPERRGTWVRRAALRAGRLAGSARHLTLCL